MERFVPMSLLESMKRKELRRLIGHFLKLNQQMTGSSKMLTQLQVSHNLPTHFLSLVFFDVRHSCPEMWLISHRWIVLGCIIIKFKAHRGICLGWKVLYKSTHWRVQQEKSERKLDFDERNLCECLSLLARERTTEKERIWLIGFFSAKLCFTNLSDIASCLMSFRFIKSLMDWVQ